ncbi:hypothetical protein HDV05_005910 [Chytridiales sp. JEL 0842]|nr:hypothetical protein HDV05_005910 [Chytridiales sp. JEL 0842]
MSPPSVEHPSAFHSTQQQSSGTTLPPAHSHDTLVHQDDQDQKGPSIVVCGLGMVGLRFCELIREKEQAVFVPFINGGTTPSPPQPTLTCSLTVFSEEPHLAYNRVGLTQYFGHQSVDRLLMQPQDWYTENKVAVHLQDPLIAIDRVNKLVTSSKGIIVPYDYLILATGSDAFVPPIPRVKELDGVFVYRSIKDVQDIMLYAKGHGRSKAAVIGGGLLGLEAAKVCVDLGLDTFVIERNPRVLARQLDDEGSTFLIKELQKLKLDCYIGANTDEFLPAPPSSSQDVSIHDPNNDDHPHHHESKNPVLSAVRLTTSTQQSLTKPIDLAIIATGIIPRDSLPLQSGIECHPRGGVLVEDSMKTTSDPFVYAIGEVARHRDMVYGLVAPGYEMADVAATSILDEWKEKSGEGMVKGRKKKGFTGADMSTKLKLMGVHVASFGDYFVDESKATGLTFRDPFAGIYKRLLFSKDGKKLLGGILVGDTNDYSKLLALTKSHKPLPSDPSALLIGKQASAAAAGNGNDDDDLPDEAQVCSCNNITKANIKSTIATSKCTSLGALRACSKAGTGCGGCIPTLTKIFNTEMQKLGVQVKNEVCEHFAYSRKELYDIVRVLKIRTFEDLMRSHGRKHEKDNKLVSILGCESCKPVAASIFASLWNDHVLDTPHAGLQDTNDRFLANIQRGGSYSVVPRVPGGEITPDKLIVLGEVGKKYGLYTKITGGQRIDLFGAQRHQLPEIWSDLVSAGFESGHAYGKALRTVKSCVGSTWCRFGRRDAVGFAVAIEQRYKGIRAPHKLKGGVSGCVRECAEAQSKDFGLIATAKGYNIYICGNGGSTPKHAVLLASDVPEPQCIQLLDRFLMYYISTADKLQRTARWLESLEGGIDFLKRVLVEDALGICAALETQMQALVGSYFCEWTEVVKNPERWAQFKQFVNSEEGLVNIEVVEERGQWRPADWKADEEAGGAAKVLVEVDNEEEEEEPPTVFKWTEEKMRWVDVGAEEKYPVNGGSAVKVGDVQVAVFRVIDADGEEKWYATQNMCPHKRAFVLSSSILGSLTSKDSSTPIPKIACPNHKKSFSLETGKCVSSDENYALATFEIRLTEDGRVQIKMPDEKEADGTLGTSKWRVKAKPKKGGKLEKVAEASESYKTLWTDPRSRRGKYEGTTSLVGHLLDGDIGDVVGGGLKEVVEEGGCASGGCGGDSRLEW